MFGNIGAEMDIIWSYASSVKQILYFSCNVYHNLKLKIRSHGSWYRRTQFNQLKKDLSGHFSFKNLQMSQTHTYLVTGNDDVKGSWFFVPAFSLPLSLKEEKPNKRCFFWWTRNKQVLSWRSVEPDVESFVICLILVSKQDQSNLCEF